MGNVNYGTNGNVLFESESPRRVFFNQDFYSGLKFLGNGDGSKFMSFVIAFNNSNPKYIYSDNGLFYESDKTTLIGNAITLTSGFNGWFKIPDGVDTIASVFININNFNDIERLWSSTNSGEVTNGPITWFLLNVLPDSIKYLIYNNASTTDNLGTVERLSDLPPQLIRITIDGNTTIGDFETGKTWHSSTFEILLLRSTGSISLSSTNVDNIFIDLDNTVTTWTESSSYGTCRYIGIYGNHAAPTSASAAARTSLASKGVTIFTN